MHGQTMVAMADAIENSEFVFICMSEAYKQSAYCQSETHYAFERQCHLIPLIMKPSHRPDGWLGILVSGKIYVDFPKLGFDIAYEKLKKRSINIEQIELQRLNRIKLFNTVYQPVQNMSKQVQQSSQQQNNHLSGESTIFQ